MPDGWYFDGSIYRTRDGFCSQKEHPALEDLVQKHLDGINDVIGEFNRDITKKV